MRKILLLLVFTTMNTFAIPWINIIKAETICDENNQKIIKIEAKKNSGQICTFDILDFNTNAVLYSNIIPITFLPQTATTNAIYTIPYNNINNNQDYKIIGKCLSVATEIIPFHSNFNCLGNSNTQNSPNPSLPSCFNCPPVNEEMLLNQLRVIETGNGNIEIKYQPTTQYLNILQSYVNLLSAFWPDMQTYSQTWSIHHNPSQQPLSFINGQLTPTYDRNNTNTPINRPNSNQPDSWIENLPGNSLNQNTNPSNMFDHNNLKINTYYKIKMGYWDFWGKKNPARNGLKCNYEFVVALIKARSLQKVNMSNNADSKLIILNTDGKILKTVDVQKPIKK